MVELEGAVLIGSGDCDKYSKINIIHPEFIVGSSESSSFVIDSGFVSKTQCIFRKTNGTWTVCDKSTCGTYVNGEKLKKDRPTTLRDGDEVAFGTANNFRYIFYTKDISTNTLKTIRVDGEVTLEEEGLQKQMMEMKIKKYPEQQEMMDHEEKLDVQEKLLQEEQDAQDLDLLEHLRKQNAEYENAIKILLERMEVMQQETMEIENDLREQLAKQKLESAEQLKLMQKTHWHLKGYLSLSEEKNQEMIENYAQLVEEELQCSICCELLVMATTLNCGHTCCRSCIVKWMEEKNYCPICRTCITSQDRCIFLDSYIDRVVENLSEGLKIYWQEVLEERRGNV